MDIRPPLLDIPRASYTGRSVSAPAPVENSPDSDMDVHCGWSLVDVTQGEAGGAPPCERSLHAAAVLNGNLCIFGGYDGHSRINDFHAYNFNEKRWSPVLPSATSGNPPSPRDRHVAVAHNNNFYVFGGFDGTSRVNDFFSFDFSSMTWREVPVAAGQPPSPRHSHAAVVHDHSMWVFGGYDGSYKSDLHEFDFDRNTWSAVNAAGRRPRARYRATCVVIRNLIVLFGGHDGTRHMADTHVFDIETRIWSALVTEGTPPTPRDSHVSLVQGSSMYIFGGSSGSAINDLYELQLPASPTSPAKWRPIKASGSFQPRHRFCHVGVVYSDAMYVFGGYDGSERLNDFIRFDFAVYDLSFEVPPSTIIDDFRSMLNDETLSDVTFIVEGQPVYAHKLMLLRSNYFRALFLGDMREASQSTIPIEQVSHPIFLNILEYLYTDQLEIALDSAMELFQAADLFCIPRLKTMCEKRMLQSITVENAAYIFHAADSHSAAALRRKALKYIVSHFEDVSKTESFEEMGRGNMELVFEILRNR
jgi:N-acetylneuraminic acid mutarotase